MLRFIESNYLNAKRFRKTKVAKNRITTQAESFNISILWHIGESIVFSYYYDLTYLPNNLL